VLRLERNISKAITKAKALPVSKIGKCSGQIGKIQYQNRLNSEIANHETKLLRKFLNNLPHGIRLTSLHTIAQNTARVPKKKRLYEPLCQPFLDGIGLDLGDVPS